MSFTAFHCLGQEIFGSLPFDCTAHLSGGSFKFLGTSPTVMLVAGIALGAVIAGFVVKRVLDVFMAFRGED